VRIASTAGRAGQYATAVTFEGGRHRKQWTAISERLTRASTANEVIDRITIAGHGEPTLHPEFEEIVTRLCAARDRIAVGMPIAILSNSTTAGWEDVRRGLALLDEGYMKLDAGDSLTYARINGGGRSIAAIIDALRTSSPIVVQSMFVADRRHEIDNSVDGAVSTWLSALETVRPERVRAIGFLCDLCALCVRRVFRWC
jgi:wyosine [tRNA(Phe)-imidazoG37] synthetase (radical SAM superfamily)